MLLTSRMVRAARPRERRYVLADEHGMSLHVMPRGSKWWRFRCRFQHTERMISLGVYPNVNLATARLFHADARGLLARDIDPSADRKEKPAASARTFEFVVRQWFKLLQPRVTKRSAGRRHGQRCDANPGARHLSGPGNSLNLRHQSARAPHGAQADRAQGSAVDRKTRQATLQPRISTRHRPGLCRAHITEDLRGLLEPPHVRHRPGVTDPARLGELLRAIDGYTGREVIGIALKLALLFVHPGELRKARWRQFDLQAAQWRIPAECMKARVQHLVPLSRQALELLLKLRRISGDSEYVFASLRHPSRPLHGTALSGALQSLGLERSEVTPHGFRATACTLLNELGWRSEAIERQMAHGVSDSIHRHYNYAQHLPERRVMMQAWADYLDGLRTSSLTGKARSRQP